ncbi:MAG TPA: hypothetical protein VGX76_19880 [Pirellulales bacterium]|nr:hypothetical protein [Pirellulales bacterium]
MTAREIDVAAFAQNADSPNHRILGECGYGLPTGRKASKDAKDAKSKPDPTRDENINENACGVVIPVFAVVARAAMIAGYAIDHCRAEQPAPPCEALPGGVAARTTVGAVGEFTAVAQSPRTAAARPVVIFLLLLPPATARAVFAVVVVLQRARWPTPWSVVLVVAASAATAWPVIVPIVDCLSNDRLVVL